MDGGDGEVEGALAGFLGPAFDGDDAVFGVDADGDFVAAKPGGHFGDEVEGFGGFGAEDYAGDACLEGAFDGFGGADAAAEFAGDFDGAGDGADGVEVALLAGEGGIEVHEVEPVAAFGFPFSREGGGVVGIDGFLVGAALLEADDLAGHEVNRGK